jgi:predicted permease
MRALVAAQVALCFVVYFAAGLFTATLDRMANQSTGFAAERLLVLETVARSPQPPAVWDQTLEQLRSVPGVESAALTGFPLLGGNGWNGFIWVNAAPTDVLGYFLAVTPGWVKTMGIPLLDGRDLTPNEVYPGAAIVNEAFAKQCFGGKNPLGLWFEKATGDGVTRDRFQVVGLVRDARYRNMREPITPTAYVPFHTVNAAGALRPKAAGTFVVRIFSQNPLPLAPVLRREVPRGGPALRVSNVRTQEELVQRHTVRERLLAMIGLFFAVVALLLSGTGLYGVLAYSVLQRRRELGIRIAIGAPSGDIARRVTWDVFTMVFLGTLVGVAAGLSAARYIEALLYQVKPTEPAAIAIPALVILAAALLAALPAVIQAVRIDPVTMLRSE